MHGIFIWVCPLSFGYFFFNWQHLGENLSNFDVILTFLLCFSLAVPCTFQLVFLCFHLLSLAGFLLFSQCSLGGRGGGYPLVGGCHVAWYLRKDDTNKPPNRTTRLKGHLRMFHTAAASGGLDGSVSQQGARRSRSILSHVLKTWVDEG